ncbi:MAG: c-type cytochrome [Pseudomonadota bacterium]|nr:c-type cytochrome [Pseudomonadota bacterium]
MSQPARVFGPALLLIAGLCPCPVVGAEPVGDHQAALAALSDVRAATAELVRADASYSTDRAAYRQASQRAITALEGARGSQFVTGANADQAGAIAHIDKLLDRSDEPVWASPLRGAEANIRAAVAHLQDAARAHELMDYEIAASRAITYLQVAQGRPSDTGVFGGLEGALANTVLGVPVDAEEADACAPPPANPAYGTHDGYIVWVSVPAKPGSYKLPEASSTAELVVQNGAVVLHTAAAKIVGQSCDHHEAAARMQPVAAQAAATQPSIETAPQQSQAAPGPIQLHPAQQTPAQQAPAPQAPTQTRRAPVQQAPPGQAEAAPAPTQTGSTGASKSPPALYTTAQAQTGEQAYGAHCASCHGGNLQGVAAPSVAGNDFLKTAKQNGWTLKMIRYLVFDMMPMNAAHSLSPTQYADVMAFLLASNCYPAGNTSFPTEDKPEFNTIQLAPLPSQSQRQNKFGVCKVG